MEKDRHLEVLSDFTNEALEGKLADEEIRRLLVLANFTQSDSSGPEAMGLLDTTGCCGRLLRRLLGGELLARGLATGGLASGLL